MKNRIIIIAAIIMMALNSGTIFAQDPDTSHLDWLEAEEGEKLDDVNAVDEILGEPTTIDTTESEEAYRETIESGAMEGETLIPETPEFEGRAPDIITGETPGQPTGPNEFAQEDSTTLRGAQFDVSNLSLGDDEQERSYFEDDDNPPIVSFFLSIIEFATQIIGTIAVILFIVAGFMFMFAQGNEQRLTDAKEVIKYAVIGLAVTFLSYVIVLFLQSLFNR